MAIVGVGQAGMAEADGRTEMEILAEAAHNAVRDAGLNLRDIDGICTSSVNATMWGLPVAEYLGIQPKMIDSTMLGGSSFVSPMLPAVMALRAGIGDAALVCYGSTRRTGTIGRAGSNQRVACSIRCRMNGCISPQCRFPLTRWRQLATCTSTAPPVRSSRR